MFCVAALSVGLDGVTLTAQTSGKAKAAGYETVMVPSGAMGRSIPVAFSAGGPHAVYCWTPSTRTRCQQLGHRGQCDEYVGRQGDLGGGPGRRRLQHVHQREQDGSKQWDTFLSSELADWLAANRGLAPGGHAAGGASQGGYAAMALAAFHPDRFGFAGSLSGFLYPSNTTTGGSILAGLQQFGGVDGNGMWGAPQLGRWKWHDPYVHASPLAQNNTRVWVYSPTTMDASDPAAMIGQAGRRLRRAAQRQSAVPSAVRDGRLATATSPRFAAFLRHPALHYGCAASDGATDPAAQLDLRHNQHLRRGHRGRTT